MRKRLLGEVHRTIWLLISTISPFEQQILSYPKPFPCLDKTSRQCGGQPWPPSMCQQVQLCSTPSLIKYLCPRLLFFNFDTCHGLGSFSSTHGDGLSRTTCSNLQCYLAPSLHIYITVGQHTGLVIFSCQLYLTMIQKSALLHNNLLAWTLSLYRGFQTTHASTILLPHSKFLFSLLHLSSQDSSQSITSTICLILLPVLTLNDQKTNPGWFQPSISSLKR